MQFKVLILSTLVLLFPLTDAIAEGEVVDILPDVFFYGPVSAATNSIGEYPGHPGRVFFKFDTSIPNIGRGELRILKNGGLDENNREYMDQHIKQSDGSTRLHPAGTMRWDPLKKRIFTQGWANYRIRLVLPGNGVGPVVRDGLKQYINITCSAIHTDNPQYLIDENLIPPNRGSALCSDYNGLQGLSPGWTDIYPQSLEFQWVDITDLPWGTYWLEMEADAHDNLLESDETNNLTRIKIIIDGTNDPTGLLPSTPTYQADQDGNNIISFDEILRVFQLFNAGEYYCDETSEDGFAPGTGDQICTPHAGDFNPPDFRLSLSEVLRIIQLYNAGGFSYCPDASPATDDDYCLDPPE